MTDKPECRKCHRPISDPQKYGGYGPRCWLAVQPVPIGAIIPRLAIARRAAEIADGQLEITLEGEET